MNPQMGAYPLQQRNQPNTVGQPYRNGGIPFLPIVLVVLYLVYISALVILPALVKGFEGSLDKVMPQLYRFIGALALFLVFGAIIAMNLASGGLKGKDHAAPGQQPIGQVQSFRPVQTPLEPTPRRFKPVPDTGQVVESEVLIKAPDLERAPSRPHLITYPSEVEGGVFGDTFIRLTPTKVLKLRSMIVGPRYLEP